MGYLVTQQRGSQGSSGKTAKSGFSQGSTSERMGNDAETDGHLSAFSNVRTVDEYKSRLTKLLGKNKCLDCGLLCRFCICDKLFDIATASNVVCQKRNTKRSVEIYVIYHPKEKLKASNTGKLIEVVCCDVHTRKRSCAGSVSSSKACDEEKVTRGWGLDVTDVQCYPVYYGVQESEDFLIRRIEEKRNTESCVQAVCFPSNDAVPISMLFHDRESVTEEYVEPSGVTISTFQLIVLDGTWRQARRMNKTIPSWVPRICLSELRISKFYIRSQSQLGRISTVEALSYVFEELRVEGYCEGVEGSDSREQNDESLPFFKDAANRLREALAVLVKAVLIQSNKLLLKERLEMRNSKCALPAVVSQPTLQFDVM